jgi:hypothetical protein
VSYRLEYRDEKGIDAFYGIGSAIDTGRTDSQRPCRRLVPKSSTTHAAINAHGRHKPDGPWTALVGARFLTEFDAAQIPSGTAASIGAFRDWPFGLLQRRRGEPRR